MKHKAKRYYFTLDGKRSRDYETRAERDAAHKAARSGGGSWLYDPRKANPKRKRKAPAKRKRNKSAIPAKVLAGHKRIWGGTIPAGALAQLEKEYARDKFKRGMGKKKNPAKRKAARKRNGSELESAATMFKKFHGKQATKVKTVQQLRVTPSVLADCGRMVDIVVAVGTGEGKRLPFRGTRLGVTGEGGQLYFVGGDQAINLKQFPHVSPSKDQVDIGEVVTICYHTSKDFHNFEPSDYEHEFGEEGGARPLLAYDVRSKRLYLIGGDYVVKREGIVN